MELIKEIFVAKKAFAAYLIVSDDTGSEKITGASTPSYNAPTRAHTSCVSAPTTTRDGCKKSYTAVPSRKNSGFDATCTSLRPSKPATVLLAPTGTVDLLTTTAFTANMGPMRPATASI